MVSGPSQAGVVEKPGELREDLPPSQTLFDDMSSQDIEKQSVDDKQQSETETSAVGVVSEAIDDGDFLPAEPPVEGRGVLSKTLSKVVSRASTKSTPGPPPDGGWLAWSQGTFYRAGDIPLSFSSVPLLMVMAKSSRVTWSS